MADTSTILLAEDDEATSRILSTILSNSGFRILKATDFQEAISVVEDEDVEIALVSGDIDSKDLEDPIGALTEKKPNIEISMMYRFGTRRSALAYRQDGIYRFLFKPVDDPGLVRRLVDEMIDHRSERLRSEHPEDEENASQKQKIQHEGDPVRVIVADSVDSEREEITGALRDLGCTVTGASCAQEALLKLSDKEYDVLIVGYDMGDMTADDVLLRARRLDDYIVVIVTATDPTLTMTTALIKKGASGFIEKPLKDPERTAESILKHGLSVQKQRSLPVEETPEEEQEEEEEFEDEFDDENDHDENVDEEEDHTEEDEEEDEKNDKDDEEKEEQDSDKQ